MSETQKMRKPRGTTLTRAEMIDRLRALHSHDEKAAAIAARLAAPEIGDMMPDGTIYAGVSPTTHQPMYAAPEGTPLRMDFNAVAQYTEELQVGDKGDFRIPDIAELQVLVDNKDKGAMKGTFNVIETNDIGWYWSSTRIGDISAWCLQVRTDHKKPYSTKERCLVRCVR